MAKKRGGAGNSNKQHDRLVKASLRKRENRSKHGDEKWKQSFNAFLQQLEPQGFYIRDVAGDGNCLFRAIADQLEDNPEQHMKYRQNIMKFISSNKDMFAPFIDEDENETFEEYVQEMQRNGSWGGNVEIQAASLIYQVNITIHQMNQPRWEIINYVGQKAKMIHLSYHNDEHYGSVRSMNQTPASLAKNAGAPVPNMNATLNNNYTNNSSGKSKIDDTTFAIMNATGVTSVKLVKEALEDCQGNFEAAIDYLIALSSQIDLSNGGVGSASDFDGEDSFDSDISTTTSTTSTSTTSTKPQKYKGKKKEKDEDNDNSKNNAHLSNKQRRELAAKEKGGDNNNNKKKRQNHNINRDDIDDDTKVELGSLNI